jgi:hypothetical protein
MGILSHNQPGNAKASVESLSKSGISNYSTADGRFGNQARSVFKKSKKDA